MKFTASFILFIAVSAALSVGAVAQKSTVFNPSMRKNSRLDTIHVHGFRPKEVTQIIENKGASKLLMFIDVRSEADYAAGHIKDAINIPLDQIEPRLKELKKKYMERTIITVDDDGSRAMQACGILSANKFAWAYYLKGGLNAWKKENYALEKSS